MGMHGLMEIVVQFPLLYTFCPGDLPLENVMQYVHNIKTLQCHKIDNTITSLACSLKLVDSF